NPPAFPRPCSSWVGLGRNGLGSGSAWIKFAGMDESRPSRPTSHKFAKMIHARPGAAARRGPARPGAARPWAARPGPARPGGQLSRSGIDAGRLDALHDEALQPDED